MPYSKRKRVLQIGTEASPPATFVAAPATTIWRAMVDAGEDARKVTEIDEMSGIIGGTDRTIIGEGTGTVTMPTSAATFEQLPYLFAYSIGGPLTGVVDAGTTPSGKIYTTPVPSNTIPTLRTCTLECADDYEAEAYTYAVINSFLIEGAMGEGVKCGGKWMTRAPFRLSSGKTPALALPAVEDIVVSKGNIYIDPISGTFGSTLLSSQIIAFKINCAVTYAPVFPLGTLLTSEGIPTYSSLTYIEHKITGDLEFLHDTAVSGSLTANAGGPGAKAMYRAQTAFKLRIEFLGSAMTAPGTNYPKKTFRIDLPCKYLKVSPLADKNGVEKVTLSLGSRYSTSAATAGNFTVALDGIATLP